MKNIIAMSVLLCASAAFSQAPAGALAGATGICKDGSFTTAPVKDGACRGHKGIQTWYKPAIPSLPPPSPGSTSSVATPTPAPAGKALPAPTPGSSPSLQVPSRGTAGASLPVPAPGATTPSQPIPTPAAAPASIPAPKPGIADQRTRLLSTPAAPGGGPGLVWVNSASKVYHCPGSDFYGKTKAGAYMTESAAKDEGDRPNRNKPCS